ncbi:MAG: hypothetical protein J1F67_07820 [Muribaculaceae bacterium]|nr:hypothetical protein [Muribaculaceae bacterium]
MKRINKFFGIGLSFAAVAGLASCDNKVDSEPVVSPEPEVSLPTVVLPQDPDLVISSDNVVFTGTKAINEEESKGTLKYENDEVEINLALQNVHYNANGETKYDLEDLVSHLSIHVRSNTDVDVTIPVPAKYYCDQDDLYIYNERSEGFKYDGSLNKATYKVENGAYKTVDLNEATGLYEENDADLLNTTVTLNIQFLPAVEENGKTVDEGSIRVWTEGVSQELIDYCRWNYGDGINFDVYNYYNRANQYATGSYAAYTVPKLLEVLNNSEVEFTGYSYNVDAAGNKVEEETEGGRTVTVYPDYYINAFTGDVIKYNSKNEDGEVETDYYYRDCWVVPTNGNFWAPTLGDHSLNHVYLNKTAFPNAKDGDIKREEGDTPWVAPAPAPSTPGANGTDGNGTDGNETTGSGSDGNN